MSNNRNSDEAAGIAIVMCFIGLVFAAIIAFYLLVILLITAVVTIQCARAWKKPITLWGNTIFPEEAQAFVNRGFAGGVIGFIAGLVMIEAFHLHRNEGPILIAGLVFGYVIGSLGIEVAKSGKKADGSPDIFPLRVIPVIEPPAPVTIDAEAVEITTPPPEPFRFAEWDDGELRT